MHAKIYQHHQKKRALQIKLVYRYVGQHADILTKSDK